MHELVIIGGGSGNQDYILPAALNAAREAGCVIASARFSRLINAEKTVPFKNIPELLERLPQMLEKESVAAVVSGDPLMYSFFRTVKERYPEIEARVIPGIGSLQLLGCAFGVTMEDAKIISIHGREYTDGKIALAVSENSTVFFLCSGTAGPAQIAAALKKYGLEHCEICVGASLSYEDERLMRGFADDFTDTENPDLCTAVVLNSRPEKYSYSALLPDSAFLRNETPMTKEEIRAVVISRLQLKPDSIVWDTGAGTGSISVECARMCRYGQVYSVEYRESALDILEKNRSYFNLENMHIVPGRAETVLGKLPEPDAVFIGGSGKSLSDIINIIRNCSRKVRIVMSAVTIETQSEAFELLKTMPEFDMIQMTVCGTRKIGAYTVLENNNPVMIYSCCTR